MITLFLNITISIVCGLLGGLSGQGYKELRRFVIPFIFVIFALIIIKSWWCLTIFSISGWLSVGYGIPSYFGEGNPYNDDGSFLGRFFYHLFNKSELYANIFTRGTIGLLISLSMLSVPILKGTWISFLVGSALIIGVWSAVSWRGFGTFKINFFGKIEYSPIVDLIVYTATTCGFLIITNRILG